MESNKDMLRVELDRLYTAMRKYDPLSEEYDTLASTVNQLQQKYNDLLKNEADAAGETDRNVVADRKVDADLEAAKDKAETELNIARIKAESEQAVEKSRAETEKVKAEVEHKKSILAAYVDLGKIAADAVVRLVGIGAGVMCVGGILKAEEVGAVTSKALNIAAKVIKW